MIEIPINTGLVAIEVDENGSCFDCVIFGKGWCAILPCWKNRKDGKSVIFKLVYYPSTNNEYTCPYCLSEPVDKPPYIVKCHKCQKRFRWAEIKERDCSKPGKTHDGKCIGYQISETNDEPQDMCKICSENQFYEGE